MCANEIEGAEKLARGGVTVTPKAGNGGKPNSFFFRVKMK
jgi:hypothetical protein